MSRIATSSWDTRGGNVTRVIVALLVWAGLIAGSAHAQDASRDLSVRVTASPNPVAAGAILTYTISVVVPSGGATGVTVTDILPSGVNYVSGTAGCSNNQGTVTCFLGNLPAGTARSTIGSRPSAGGTVQNVVGVIANEYDSNMSNNSATVTTTVNGPVTVVLSPSTLPNPTVGVSYNQTLTASGGTGPYTFGLITGSLPLGLTLTASGPTTALISGTPTTGGPSSFTIRATDSLSHTGSQSYTVTTFVDDAVVQSHTIPTGMTTGQVLTVNVTMQNTGTSTWTPGTSYRLGDAAPTPGQFGPTRADMSPGSSVGPGATYTFSFTLTAPTTAGSYIFGWRMLREGIHWFGAYAPVGGFSMQVTSPVVISPSTLPNPTVGVSYSQTLTASGGTGPYTFGLITGSLPLGLMLTASGPTTALISGTPTTGGPSSFTIRATDSLSHTGSQSYTVTTFVDDAVVQSHTIPTGMTTGQVLTVNVTMQNTGTSTWTPGTSYRLGDAAPTPGQFGPTRADMSPGSSVGPGATYTFSFTLTAPTTAGSYIFGWRMLREGIHWFGAYAPVGGFSMQVTSPVVISPSTLPNPTVGVSYNQTLTASGGTGPYTFGLITGSLPLGLTLTASGPTTALISGTPTTGGPSSFTIRATDSLSHTGSQSYTVTTFVDDAVVQSHTIPTSMTTGQVLTVNVTMQNTGTSTWTPGTSYRLGDAAPTPGQFGPTRADMSPGSSVGPGATYTFSFTLTAPTTAGSYIFGWRMLREGIHWFGAYAPVGGFSMQVTSPVVISPTSLPNPTVGVSYNQTLTASGGTGPYTFGLITGSLPLGLTLTASGPTTALISGTPTTGGPSSFTIRATDSLSHTGSQSYTVTTFVDDAVVQSHTIPTGMTTGQVLTVNVTMQNTGTSTWTPGTSYRLGDAAPTPGQFGPTRADMSPGSSVGPGATYTFSFTLTAPTTAGSYIFGWRMLREGIHWFGAYAPVGGFSMQVTSPVVISPSTLPNPTVGVSYNQTLTASGGTGPYTFGLITGSLPLGLTLTASGPTTALISGTPTTGGPSSFTIRATDSLSHTGSQSYTVTTFVDDAVVQSHTIPTGMTTGQVLTVNVTMQNTGTSTWTPGTSYRLGDAAPTPGQFGPTRADMSPGSSVGPGATYTFSFTLTAPTTAGSYIFGWRMLREGIHWFGAYAPVGGFSMQVTSPVVISPSTLPNPTVGVSYNQTLTASGGTGPYTFGLITGSLPLGLTLTASGPTTALISGTPTTGGPSSFTIRATDSLSHTGSQSYTVTTFVDDAVVQSHTIPTGMTTGQVLTVNVTMQNTGTSTWTPGTSYRLGDAAPTPGQFGPTRADMSPGSSVGPGATYTFSFTLTAPTTAGSYIFGWRMLREGIHWFGAYAPVGGFSMRVGVNIFTSQAPTSEGPAPNYEIATQFVSSSSGSITHLRFWMASTETGSHTLRLWNDSSGPPLTTVVVPSAVPGWNEIQLPSAYPISGGVRYRVSYNTNATQSKTFSDCNPSLYPVAHGPLTALSGFYSVGAGNFPATPTCSLVFADVRFLP